MKKHFKISALIGLAVLLSGTASLRSAPLVTVGDSVDIFFSGLAEARFQSNVFNAPNAASDLLLILGPGVEMNIGRDSAANIRILFREDFYFYNRYTDFDIARANVYIDGNYSTGPLTSSAGFSFVQTQQNNRGAQIGIINPATGLPVLQNNLIKRDLYRAYLNGRYNWSPKWWSAAGFEWARVSYTNNVELGGAYSDSDIYTFPIDLFYRVTPKWSIGPGFRYRYTDAEPSPGNQAFRVNPGNGAYYNDYFFNVAITGEVLPKLDLNVNLGYELRDGTNVSDDGAFAMLSEFTYYYSEKLTFLLDFTKDFGLGAQGGSTDLIGVGTGVRYDITPYVFAQGNFDYYNNTYETGPQSAVANGGKREDNTYATGASVTWVPDPIVRLTLGYGFYYNDSNVTGLSYRSHTVNLSATFRY